MSDVYSSARSQVLSTPELLDIIFFHVQMNDALRVLSLTCKAFFNPAMDHLWRTLDSFSPLLRTIPSVVVTEEIISSTRILQDDDIERFVLYARRIQTIIIGGIFGTTSPYIYQFLARPRQQPLFPLLKYFAVMSPTELYSSNALLFPLISANSPYLSSTSIYGIDEDVEVPMASFLQELAHSPKDVRTLCLSGRVEKITLYAARQLGHLTRLAIYFTGDTIFDFVKVLSGIPCLKDLTIEVFNSVEHSITHFESASFRNLRTLRIEGWSEAVCMIFCAIYPDNLEALTLFLGDKQDEVTAPHVAKTIQHIVSTPIAKTLQLLELGHRLLWNAFLPLYHSPLPSIDMIDVNVDYIGQDILYGNTNWKTLQTLKLSPLLAMQSMRNSISICDLPIFTEICPNLQLLDIGVRILGLSEIEKLRSHSQGRCSCHGLQNLKLSCLTSTEADFIDVMFVGRFIDTVFPQLTAFEMKGSVQRVPLGWNNKWSKGVEAMVGEFRDVKKKVGHVCTTKR